MSPSCLTFFFNFLLETYQQCSYFLEKILTQNSYKFQLTLKVLFLNQCFCLWTFLFWQKSKQGHLKKNVVSRRNSDNTNRRICSLFTTSSNYVLDLFCRKKKTYVGQKSNIFCCLPACTTVFMKPQLYRHCFLSFTFLLWFQLSKVDLTV